MKIECKLKRVGGTHVDMGTAKYHFAPLEDGAHVATVTNEQHQDRFLGITEAYGLYRGALDAPLPVAAPVQTMNHTDGTKSIGAAPLPPLSPAQQDGDAPAPEVLLGASNFPPSFDIHGVTYSLVDIVAKAHTGSGLDVKEWNELEESSRADLIDEVLDGLHEAGPADAAAEVARAAASEKYQEKFGKKPHHKWNAEKILAEIAAAP